MLDLAKAWLSPEGVALILTLVGLLVSLVKGRKVGQKFQETSLLLTTVIQGVQNYRDANPTEQAKVRDEIQLLADKIGVEETLNKAVKAITETK